MELLICIPTLQTSLFVIQHAWKPTMNLPAQSSLKCEHETYEPLCSYPHTRVQPIRTSSLASIMHSNSITNLPICKLIKHIPDQIIKFTHAEPLTKSSYPCTIVWPCLSTVRRNSDPNLLVGTTSCYGPRLLEPFWFAAIA